MNSKKSGYIPWTYDEFTKRGIVADIETHRWLDEFLANFNESTD